MNIYAPVTPPPLKCFQHCMKDTDLICFTLPKLCPLCEKPTSSTESLIPPYILPSPFVSSPKCARSVVLKPTQGNFLWNYVPTCNLHIGISDKNGFVYNFDERGLNYGTPWEDCLAVSFDRSVDDSIWDICLIKVVEDTNQWIAVKYHENEWNCFDFVLHFMKLLARHSESHHEFAELSKEEFTTLFLKKKTRRAEEYIHLFRQVIAKGCVSIGK